MKKTFQATLVSALAAHCLLVSAVMSTATAHAGVVVVARPVTISRPVAAPATRAPAAAPSAKSVPVAIAVSPAKGLRPMAAVPVIMVPITTSAGRDDCSGKSKTDCKK